MDNDIIKDTPLPSDVMPSDWNDDMRMNSLFSPFRNRNVNPLDWDRKLAFWKSLIQVWCIHYKRSTFTPGELNKTFHRKGRSPLCLSTVIEEMLRSGEISVESEYLKFFEQQSWTWWTVEFFFKRPLIWSLNKVKNTVIRSSYIDESVTYVHLEATKVLGEKLLKSVNNANSNIFSVEYLEGVTDNNGNLLPILQSLILQRKIVVSSNNKFIKLMQSKHDKPIITEVEIGMYTLAMNEQILKNNLLKLEEEKQKEIAEAKMYLSKGMRQMAKSCLRKKNGIEKFIEKRSSALDNVQQLLNQLRQTESDSKVLECYKLGIATLKTSFSEAGLTEDNVSNTMIELEDILDVSNDIQASLSQPQGELVDTDLEEELTALLNSSSSISDSKDTAQKLRDVEIKGSPSSATSSTTKPMKLANAEAL